MNGCRDILDISIQREPTDAEKIRKLAGLVQQVVELHNKLDARLLRLEKRLAKVGAAALTE